MDFYLYEKIKCYICKGLKRNMVSEQEDTHTDTENYDVAGNIRISQVVPD